MQLALDLAALLASVACLVQNFPHPLAHARAPTRLGTVAPILPLAISAVGTGLALLRHLNKTGPNAEAPEKACTWLGEISSCSCLTLQSCKIYRPFPGSL